MWICTYTYILHILCSTSRVEDANLDEKGGNREQEEVLGKKMTGK